MRLNDLLNWLLSVVLVIAGIAVLSFLIMVVLHVTGIYPDANTLVIAIIVTGALMIAVVVGMLFNKGDR